MIIGLTGENCAGKSTVADYLTKKSFYYLSLSDVIREELKAEGKALTRQNMIEKGNELRGQFGPGILGAKIIAMMENDRNYVVDSIRNPAEVEELKKKKGFYLVHITAPHQIRFQRMRSRDREEDPRTFAAFQKIEALEMKNAEKTKQNIQATVEMADKKIENVGDLTELYDKVNETLGELSSEFKMDRPSWDEYFMGIAKVVASRSNCIKRKVAAVIVRDKRIISTGYNGTPRGTTNCNENGCKRCNSWAESGSSLGECVCSHAEENAITQCAYHGISTKDSILYVNLAPCLICTKMIINSGIKEVVYDVEYMLNDESKRLFKEAKVILRQFKLKK